MIKPPMEPEFRDPPADAHPWKPVVDKLIARTGEWAVVVGPSAAAALIFAYPLYRSVWPLPPGEYAILPLVYLGWVAIGVLLLVHTRAKRPEVLVRMMSEETKF